MYISRYDEFGGGCDELEGMDKRCRSKKRLLVPIYFLLLAAPPLYPMISGKTNAWVSSLPETLPPSRLVEKCYAVQWMQV